MGDILAIRGRLALTFFAFLAYTLFGTSVPQSFAGTYKFNDCTYPSNGIPSSIYSGPFHFNTGEMTTTAVPSKSRFTWSDCSVAIYNLSPRPAKGSRAAVRYALPNGLKFDKVDYLKLWGNGGSGGWETRVDLADASGGNRMNLAQFLWSGEQIVSDITPTGVDRRLLEGYFECKTSTCGPEPYPGPPGEARVQLLDTVLTIKDVSAPLAWLSGTIVTGSSPVSGSRTMQAMSLDFGSGVRSVYYYVNGSNILTLYNPNCTTNGSKLVPCSSPFNPTITVDTTKAPWVNGNNTLVVCSNDYAEAPSYPNLSCSPASTVVVSN